MLSHGSLDLYPAGTLSEHLGSTRGGFGNVEDTHRPLASFSTYNRRIIPYGEGS